LAQVYKDNYDLLSKDLEIYDSSEQKEELYVRAATQIANLPKELEDHYATYFNNQDAIVAYYDSYITPFNELEAEMNALEKELKDLGAKIDQETTEYETRANNLSTAVNEFNNCANTVNCFSSQYAFNVRRNELLSEQSALDELYNTLSSDIDSYNQKVEKYNSSLLRTKELEDIINSNVDPDEIIK
jgi:chromosome segregation ATPase